MKGSRWKLWAVVLALGLVAGCKKKETDADKKKEEEKAQQKAAHDARLVSNHFGKVLYVKADAEEPDENAQTQPPKPRCDSWANACTLKEAFKMVGEHQEEMDPKPQQDSTGATSAEGAQGQTTATATPAGSKDKSTRAGSKDKMKEGHNKGGPGKAAHKKMDNKGKVYIALAAGDYDVTEELRVNFNRLHHMKKLVIRGGWKKDAELLLPEKKKANSQEGQTSTGGESSEDNKTVLKAGNLKGRDSLLALDMAGATTRAAVRIENLEITGSKGQRAVLDAKVGLLAKLTLEEVNVNKNEREAKVITVRDTSVANYVRTKVTRVGAGAVVEIQSAGEVHFVNSMFKENKSQLYGAVRVDGLRLTTGNSPANAAGGKLYVKGCSFEKNRADRIVVTEKAEGATGFASDNVDIVLKDKEAWILSEGAGALTVSESQLWLQKNMDKETEFKDNVAVGALYKDQVDTTKSYVKMGHAPAVFVEQDAQLRKVEAKFSSNKQELVALKAVVRTGGGNNPVSTHFGSWQADDSNNGSESRDGVFVEDYVSKVAPGVSGGGGGNAGEGVDAAKASNFVLVGSGLTSAYTSSL